jgi:hypothetical protein
LNYIYESNLQKKTGGSTKRMGNLSSAFKKADIHWEQKLKCRLEIWQKTQTRITVFLQYVFAPTAQKKGIKISHQRT